MPYGAGASSSFPPFVSISLLEMSALKTLNLLLKNWVHFFFLLTGCMFLPPSSRISNRDEVPPLDRILKPIHFIGPKIADENEKEGIQKVNAIFYYLAAARLDSFGHDEEAQIALERLLELDPESSAVQAILGERYLERGRTDEGQALLRKAIELDPKNRKARLVLANFWASTKKFQVARNILLELEKDYPNDEEITLYSVLLDIEEKNLQLADNRLEKFLLQNSDSALGHFYLGRVKQEMGFPKQAVVSYKRALEIRPGFVQAGTYLGFLQEELGDKSGALETYLWLADATDDVTFHRKIGQIYLEKEKVELALKAFENLERVDPKDLNNRLKIALLLIDQQKPDSAVEKFREILKESPKSENVRFYLGALFEEQNNYVQALKEYEKISPESDLFTDSLKRQVYLHGKLKQREQGLAVLREFENRGWSDADFKQNFYEDLAELSGNLLEMTDALPEEFLKELDQALKLYPQSQRLHYTRGSLLERRGDLKGAELAMLEVLKVNPDHAAALNFVGYIWADQGIQLKKAQVYIEKALKLKPKDPFILDSLGWVYFRQGRVSEAEKILREAHEIEPEESVILDHLGDVLVKTGRLEEAKRLYEQALQIGPARKIDSERIRGKLENFHFLVGTNCEFPFGQVVPKCQGTRLPASEK